MSDAAQLHELINLVLVEDRTGILSVRCALNRSGEVQANDQSLHSFSFLFRKGQLVSARLGMHQDFEVLEFVPLIASVAKARWTPMRPDAITVTDASLSVETLAELIHHATALPSKKAPPSSRFVSGVQGEGKKLLQRAHKVFSEVFGEKGEAILLEVINKINPEANPMGFLHRCIDRLAPYLGLTNAANLMIPPKNAQTTGLLSLGSPTAG